MTKTVIYVYLFLAVSLLSIVTTSLSQYNCTEENFFKTQANPKNATSYYICYPEYWEPISKSCPEDLVFNAAAKGCTYKYDSPQGSCPTEGQLIPVHDGTCTKYKVCKNTGTAANVQLELELLTCNNGTPIFDPFVGKCVKKSDYFTCGNTRPDCNNPEYEDKLLAAPDDCESFYKCNDGVRVKNRCDTGKVFDAVENCIDHSKRVCSTGPFIQDICKGKEEHLVADPHYCRGFYYCYDRFNPLWSYCPNNNYYYNQSCTSKRPANCKCEGLKLPFKGKVYVSNASDKTKYAVCEKGEAPVEKTCPTEYKFDADEQACVIDS